MTGRVLCLIGAQFGSEGKGVVVQHIARDFQVHVRVGGPNAGHTLWHAGRLWKMRSLPCGWINSEAQLVIGAGALVDVALLEREIDETGTDPRRVWVDPRAVVISELDRTGKYELRDSIGATGEGVGPARLRRVARRRESVQTIGDLWLRDGERGFNIGDTVELLAQARDRGMNILLEGTQGSGLSLVHGHWPYVTSHDTGAAQLLADVGLPPVGAETLMVARTFPIRVGGNSGPLANETTWEDVSKQAGRPVEEFTTVTGRLRRVGYWDERQMRKAILLNRPQSLALMFLDYVFPETEAVEHWPDLSMRAKEFVQQRQRELGVFIEYVGTGGPQFALIRREAA